MRIVKVTWINALQRLTISKDFEGHVHTAVECACCQNYWHGKCRDGRNERRPVVVSDCIPVVQSYALAQEVAR